MEWTAINAPAAARPPAPITMRVQAMAARTYFPEHAHDWAQLVYAISGVLSVGLTGRSLVISPQQAVLLPVGVVHRVGTLMGAEFRSIWIAADLIAPLALAENPVVFGVSPLLKALVAEAAQLDQVEDDDGYRGRITEVILDQLRRATPIPVALPWPNGKELERLCEALYSDPTDERPAEGWARELGLSSRTLTRRFEAEVGMSLRSWRRKMRLFKAIEMLGGGLDVTSTAMELGYGSASAFCFAFRREMGVSPQVYGRAARGAA